MAIKSTLGSQPLSHPNLHLLPGSAPGHRVKFAHAHSRSAMSGVPHTFDRGSLPTGGGGRTRIPPDELRARRYGGDFSHMGPVFTESNRPPSSIPDFDEDDLPRIPSTSTGLWGDDAVTISTEMMGSPTASPVVGCPPLSVPSHQECEREPLTEAQQIAAQYRQRHHSSPEPPSVSVNPLESRHPSPPSTTTKSGVSVETQAMNAPLRASLTLPQSPPVRGLLSRVREDGTVACDREDCLEILPNLQAFLCHQDIHLIHEEYVIRLGWRIGVLSLFCLTD